MTRFASNSSGLNDETLGEEARPGAGVQCTFGSNSGPFRNYEVKPRGRADKGPWTKAL